MARAPAAVALAALLLVVPGCIDQGGLPELQMTVNEPEAKWGQAVAVTIENVGQEHRGAPIGVEVVAGNGSVVRTYEDVTADRGIPPNGQVTVTWNGLDDQGRPVLWGNYTIRTTTGEVRGVVEILRPDNYAITVDPDPRETPAGSEMSFHVKNNGTVWLNGSLTVAAGKDDTVLYNNTAPVELAPGESYTFHWQGRDPDGERPEPDKYLVAARMDLDESSGPATQDGDGPTPFAQDVFTLTEA